MKCINQNVTQNRFIEFEYSSDFWYRSHKSEIGLNMNFDWEVIALIRMCQNS